MKIKIKTPQFSKRTLLLISVGGVSVVLAVLLIVLLSTSQFSAQALHDSNDDIVTASQLSTTTTTHATNTSETTPKQTKSIETRSTPIATTTKDYNKSQKPSLYTHTEKLIKTGIHSDPQRVWHNSTKCPHRGYSIGFQLGVKATGLIAIRLICHGNIFIQSPAINKLNETDFSPLMQCKKNEHLIGFRIKQKPENRSASFPNLMVAKNIDMRCSGDEYASHLRGIGNDVGDWSEWVTCPVGYRIVRLRSQQEYYGARDTNLLGVGFICDLPNEDEYVIESDRTLEESKLTDRGKWDDSFRECPNNTLAVGFELVHAKSCVGKCDDETGLHQIRLVCPDGSFVQSPQFYDKNKLWPENSWQTTKPVYATVRCKAKDAYLIGFKYRVDRMNFGPNDNYRGATNIDFRCSDGQELEGYAMNRSDTSSIRGIWQTWKSCADGYGISGLQGQSDLDGSDKSGLVNIRFKCRQFKYVESGLKFIGNEKLYNIGNWGPVGICPRGFFGTAFELAYMDEKSFEKGIANIRLICWTGLVLQSHLTPKVLGIDRARVNCPDFARMVGFQLKTNKPQRNPDISGVTNIRITCSDGTVITDKTLDSFNTTGEWGPVHMCELEFGIVGLQAQSGNIEPFVKGTNQNSGLTNLNMACAAESKEKDKTHYQKKFFSQNGILTWDSIRKCPDGDLAIGFQAIVQDRCDIGTNCDNTGLNQIRMFCERGSIIQSPDLSPSYPIFGSPKNVYMCKKNSYIVRFELKSAPYYRDDLFHVTDARMMCSNNETIGPDVNSTWDSSSCPKGLGVQGLQVELDNHKEAINTYTRRNDHSGLTAINYACTAPKAENEQNQVSYIKSNTSWLDVGNWDSVRTCPNRTSAIGVQLMIHDWCNRNDVSNCDNTGLNQIKLICEDGWVVKSPQGPPLYGDYRQAKYCAGDGSFLTGFRLRIDKEGQQAGATDIEMYCSSNQHLLGSNDFGEWQEWKTCPLGQRIVGLQAQLNNGVVHPKLKDDMGITNANFACRKF